MYYDYDPYLEGFEDGINDLDNDYDYDEDSIDYDDIGMSTDYEDSYLEGYTDALNEMEVKLNPLPIIGGGDVKGDLKSYFGIGNSPDRAAAMKYYMMQGNTAKGGILGGTYGVAGDGIAYRKNRFLPGANSNPIATNYDAVYMRLNPRDREKIMKNYLRKHKSIL